MRRRIVTKFVKVPPLSLALGAHEKDRASASGSIAHQIVARGEGFESLLQVYDVDTVAFSEDIRPHLGVPATGAMAEVNAGLEECLHTDVKHSSISRFVLVPPPSSTRHGTA